MCSASMLTVFMFFKSDQFLILIIIHIINAYICMNATGHVRPFVRLSVRLETDDDEWQSKVTKYLNV